MTSADELIGCGDTQVHVTSPDELPEGAPRLDVRVITRPGGTVVTTDESTSQDG